MSHINLVVIDQLSNEKSLFKKIIEKLANIFFRMFSAVIILVVHSDTLYHHLGTGYFDILCVFLLYILREISFVK